MSPRKRRYLRIIITALVLLLVTAWVVPSFFNAERYRPLLKSALEKALHRRITFGRIALHLFPQPGFTVDNVVVGEAPAFGLEPFARVQSIDCELLWRSLWHSGLEFGTLQLEHPSINLVRNAAGEWNIENLLLNSGIARPPHARASGASHLPSLRVEADDARFNFKLRQDKKPFAVVDSQAEIDIDFDSRRISFRLSGDPVRTDLELPTPGPVELEGTWKPAEESGNTLDATLRTRGSLLYDWIPLVTGRNPGVYGVVDSTIHLTGTFRKIGFDGDARLSQLHRWEQLPPSNDLPCRLHFQGVFDRDQRKLSIRTFDLGFADSEASVEGSIEKLTSRPDFDLVVAFKRSRLQDLLKFGRRVLGKSVGWDITGNVDGKLKVLGPWAERRYEGALTAREVRLRTSSGTYPVSKVAIRIAQDRVRLFPTRVRLARGVEVVAEGSVWDISPARGRYRPAVKPRYGLTFYSHAVALTDLLNFGRALGLKQAEGFAAEGIGTFTLRVTGPAWPLSRPHVTAQATIRSARLAIPGLTQPVNIPRARIEIYGKQVVVNPLVAVMGTSVFSGWLMHEGPAERPWSFSLEADKLSVGQGAVWFEATQSQSSASLFDRLPGIGALLRSRHPGPGIFSRLNAEGHFSTPALNYRALTLRNFKAKVDIFHRAIRVFDVTFEAGGGRGRGTLLADLRQSPAQISAEVSMEGARLQTLASYMPRALAKVHGLGFASGHFSARGLTHAEITRSLQGEATVRLVSISLGNFDPVSELARRAGLNAFETDPQPAFIPSAVVHLQVQNRQLAFKNCRVGLSGAKLKLAGTYGFDGTAAVQVHADLSGLRSRWRATLPRKGARPRQTDVRLAGPLRHLRILPATRLLEAQP